MLRMFLYCATLLGYVPALARVVILHPIATIKNAQYVSVQL